MNFSKSPAGRVVQSPRGCSAFVPHPLPPKIERSLRIVAALSKADFLVGTSLERGASSRIPIHYFIPLWQEKRCDPAGLRGPGRLDDVLRAEAGVSNHYDPVDLKEVENYVIALEFGIDRLRDLPHL